MSIIIAKADHPLDEKLVELEAFLDEKGLRIIIYPMRGLGLREVDSGREWWIQDMDSGTEIEELPRAFDSERLFTFKGEDRV